MLIDLLWLCAQSENDGPAISGAERTLPSGWGSDSMFACAAFRVGLERVALAPDLKVRIGGRK